MDEYRPIRIDFDIINIATPNGSHAENAIKCLESSKHVIIEKPMALTVDQCDEIVAVAAAADFAAAAAAAD